MKIPEDQYPYVLWRICVHEAAHVVVAHKLGYPAAHMRIYERPESEIGDWDAPYTGHAYALPRPEDHEQHSRLCSLAGEVGEYMLDGSPTGVELMDLLEEGEIVLSDTDAASAGAYTEADLDQCISIVREYWDEILAKAREAFEMGPREPPE